MRGSGNHQHLTTATIGGTIGVNSGSGSGGLNSVTTGVGIGG